MGTGVTFDHVTFTYAGREAASITGVGLTIAPGEFVVLTGASGCGKSTLVKAACGLIPHAYPSTLTGTVRIGDSDIATMRSWEIAQRVGVVFQDPRSQFFTTTVDDEIAFACENLGMPTAQIDAEVTRAARLTGIGNLRGRPIFGLSSGQKQLVALASAIAAHPDVVLLDEPSANLDPDATARLGSVLDRLHDLGHTIVVAEHRLAFLTGRADRIVRLDEGAITHAWPAAVARALPAERLRELGLRATRDAPTRDPAEPSAHAPTARPAEPDIQVPITHRAEPRTRAANDSASGRRLSLQEATARAGRATVLQRLTRDIAARPGEIVAITGPIGAGKTTLARVIAGLTPLRSGAVQVDGATLTTRQRVRQAFLVTQDTDYQLFSDTVAHELLLSNPKLTDDRSRQILDELGLTGRDSDHPLSLSGGQKQRLAIAAAVASGADILVFDEPSSGLDADNMRRVAHLLEDLSAAGALVIVTTHDEELLQEVPHTRIHLTHEPTS